VEKRKAELPMILLLIKKVQPTILGQKIQLKQSDSPFKITASALTNDAIPSSLAEDSYLG